MNREALEEIIYRAVSKILSAEEAEIPDITAENIGKRYFVENGADREDFQALRAKTPARLGVGRAGMRYQIHTQLRFLADHAAAQDAVLTKVSSAFISTSKLPVFKTMCLDREEYITRPDLGRVLTPESKVGIKALHEQPPDALFFVADGLSSAAVEENAMDVLWTATADLKRRGLSVGQPFFVESGRVGVMDEVSELTAAKVVCVLIGERPGLMAADSMSAYIAYDAKVGMSESRRTVISNIHKKGTPAVEAGAWISDLIQRMLQEKSSGVELAGRGL